VVVRADRASWKGGVLRGQSPVWIAFLRPILTEGAAQGLDPLDGGWQISCACVDGAYYLCCLGGSRQSVRWEIELAADAWFTVEVIDNWEMTSRRLDGAYSGRCEPELRGKPSVALRIRRVR
jgi:hypothetical protein